MKEHNHESGVKGGQSGEDGADREGQATSGYRRSEVQEEPAEGHAAGAGAGSTRRAGRRGSSPPGGHSAQPSPPTFSGPGAGFRPGAAG